MRSARLRHPLSPPQPQHRLEAQCASTSDQIQSEGDLPRIQAAFHSLHSPSLWLRLKTCGGGNYDTQNAHYRTGASTHTGKRTSDLRFHWDSMTHACVPQNKCHRTCMQLNFELIKQLRTRKKRETAGQNKIHYSSCSFYKSHLFPVYHHLIIHIQKEAIRHLFS